MLLDSNIVIYAARPEHAPLRRFIAEHAPVISVITYIEVLGYHRLQELERHRLERFFRASEMLPLSNAVVEHAVRLRQQQSTSLGDSIIGATALVYGHTLVTHNTADFEWITELKLNDPLDEHA